MNSAAEIAFDDEGAPVGLAQFDYDGLDCKSRSDSPSQAHDALEILKCGLLLIIKDGPVASLRVRAGALARLCDLFESDAEAARELHVNRSTMTRAVRRMRNEIVREAQRKKP